MFSNYRCFMCMLDSFLISTHQWYGKYVSVELTGIGSAPLRYELCCAVLTRNFSNRPRKLNTTAYPPSEPEITLISVSAEMERAKACEDQPSPLLYPGGESTNSFKVNPFARRETHDKNQLLAYKILTIVSWVLVLVASISCSFSAEGRRTIWEQNRLHPTPFSLNPVITDLYWCVLSFMRPS